MARVERTELPALLLAAAVTALVTWGYRAAGISNSAIVVLTYLMIVLAVATLSSLRVAIVLAVATTVCLNFFFLPPVGTLTIADPQNWVALFVFVGVSVVASNLSSAARRQAADARLRRDEVTRLFDLTRDILLVSGGPEALDHVARFIARRFRFDQVLVCVVGPDGWEQHGPTDLPREPEANLDRVMARSRATLEFDAHTRTYAGHEVEPRADGAERAIVPVRRGAEILGLLVIQGPPSDPGTRDAIAGVAAVAVERLALLDERRQAEVVKRSADLRSALFASVSHDLRTPLTAIRIAATNVAAPELPAEQRAEQITIIQQEVQRLTRLFQNIVDMAQIDTESVAPERERVTAADVVEAAERLVEPALVGREIRVDRSHGRRRVADRSAIDVHGACAPARERRAVLAGGLGRRHRHVGGQRRGALRGARPWPRRRARGASPAVRPVLSRPRERAASVRIGPRAGDHARPAGGAGWPRLGRQSSRRRGGVHDRRAMRPALILFVDDEKAIQRSMVPLLRSRGYSVTPAETGKDALAAFDAERPDLVVLDLGLPDMDGTVVVERIRARSDVPVLILSARLTEPDKIAALDRGADDYITKPFSPEELLARVRAALRRALGQEQTTRGQLTAGSIAIDLERRKVTVDGREVHLTPKEFDLLSLLAARAGQVVTHRAILRAIWGPHSSISPSTCACSWVSCERRSRTIPRAPRGCSPSPGWGIGWPDE